MIYLCVRWHGYHSSLHVGKVTTDRKAALSFCKGKKDWVVVEVEDGIEYPNLFSGVLKDEDCASKPDAT